jgi:hypothetical protein
LALKSDSPPTAIEKSGGTKAAQQDVFAREVDDAMREDQMRTALRKYGVPAGATVLAGLLGLAGYLWYSEHQQSVAGGQGEKFAQALDQVEAGRIQTGKGTLAPLSKSGGPGYQAAVKLAEAGILQEQRKDAAAATIFANLAGDSSVPKPYRDVAAIREIATKFDTLPPEQVIDRLRPLAVPGNPWFGSAGELVALAYLKQGKSAQAGTLLAAMSKDKTIAPSLRQRARQLAGQLGVDAIDSAEIARVSAPQ